MRGFTAKVPLINGHTHGVNNCNQVLWDPGRALSNWGLLYLHAMKRQKAFVLRSTGSWYQVMLDDGRQLNCRIRGKMRLKGVVTTNPVAAGDNVFVEELSAEEGAIVEVEPRKNYIIRRSVNLSRRAHIIASNIDLAFLVITVANPQTHYGFIDRFTVAAEAYKIPVILVFNKVDQYNEAEQELLAEYMAVYHTTGYPMLLTSAVTGMGLNDLKSLMENKVSLFSGNSGVGKSSLINAIEPGLNLKTQHISSQSGSGQHTTTFAEMHPLSFGGYIADTPGIKGFGLVDIDKNELSHYFPEMHALLPDCKFYNCLHQAEPGCAVKRALETGEVAERRYASYLAMFNDEEFEDYR